MSARTRGKGGLRQFGHFANKEGEGYFLKTANVLWTAPYYVLWSYFNTCLLNTQNCFNYLLQVTKKFMIVAGFANKFQ